MSIDPDPIAERSRTVPRDDLKLINDDEAPIEEQANVNEAIQEIIK